MFSKNCVLYRTCSQQNVFCMLHTKKTSDFLLHRKCIKRVLSQTLAHLGLEVAVDTRRVDRHFALVCIHEEGLSSHLQVGQGRDEYFVLVGVLRQERQAGAAVNVADIKLEEHRHLLAADVAHRHQLVCGCGEEAEVNMVHLRHASFMEFSATHQTWCAEV